jgi:hypothetical protein
MTLEEKISALLTAPASAVFALIAARTYPEGEVPLAAQSSGAYIVFQQIASDPKETHGTGEDAEDTLDGTLYQFNCYAKTGTLARRIRSALRADLLAPGAIEDVAVATPTERSGSEPEVKLCRVDLDVTFLHNPLTV